MRLAKVGGLRTLLSYAHGRGFELYLNNGEPRFRVGAGKSAVLAVVPEGVALRPGRWHHLAGVFDGATATLYLDGKAIAKAKGRPAVAAGGLRIGAASKKNNGPTSLLGGLLDEVRLSSTSRYRGGFQPPSRAKGFRADSRTLLLLHLDRNYGPWVRDGSKNGAHPLRKGKASCIRD